jgi:hypothetical protein
MNPETEGSKDMREDYDFSLGVRGKYARQFLEGSNVVVLDPDVAAGFGSREEINEALRDQLRRRRASGSD